MSTIDYIRSDKCSLGSENRGIYFLNSCPAGIVISVSCIPVKMSGIEVIVLHSTEDFHLAYRANIIKLSEPAGELFFSFLCYFKDTWIYFKLIYKISVIVTVSH